MLGCLVRAWLGRTTLLCVHVERGSALPVHYEALSSPNDDPMPTRRGEPESKWGPIADSVPRFLGLPLAGFVPVLPTPADAFDSAWFLWLDPTQRARHAALWNLWAWFYCLTGTSGQCLCFRFPLVEDLDVAP